MYITCTLLCVLQAVLVQSTLAPSHLLTTRVGPCNDFPGGKITVSELEISTHTYDSSLSGELNITENIQDGWKIKATMQKCQDIRNTDTCDYFKSFYLVKNGCEGDDDEEQELYSMFFHYAHPRLDCPVRVGVYNITGYPLFTEDNYLMVSESKISTSIFGYTYRLDGFTKKMKRILCVEAYLQLLYIRDHNWAINKTVQIETTPAPDNDEDHTKDDETTSSEEINNGPEENSHKRIFLGNDGDTFEGNLKREGDKSEEDGKSHEDRTN